MTRRINLLSKQEKYLKLEGLFSKLRFVILIMGVIVFIVDIVFFAILIGQKNNLDNRLNEKKSLLQFLVTNKEAEARFIYLRNKEQQISTDLKNDVNFYPYYNLLNNSLKSSSPVASLDSVTIDKTKGVDFSVGFTDFNSLSSFFKFAESDDFLKNFTSLNLEGFNTVSQAQKGYSLNFKGKFIEIK